MLVFACGRKAPGPEECRTFALSVFRLEGEGDLGGSLRGQALREEVDNLTRECLVMPYDREFLRCIEGTGRARVCRAEFEIRKASRSERMLSR
jgi:hypothetical protein